MTVKELKTILEKMDENEKIILGVQGYTTEEPDEIRIEETPDGVRITDMCYYSPIIWE